MLKLKFEGPVFGSRSQLEAFGENKRKILFAGTKTSYKRCFQNRADGHISGNHVQIEGDPSQCYMFKHGELPMFNLTLFFLISLRKKICGQ